MRIGIPRELKPLEGRVGMTPAACAGLVREGHQVFIETGAGRLSGYDDAQYREVGVEIVPDHEAAFKAAEMVVKVKEPIAEDLKYLRKDHLLFCYLHLAAEPALTKALQAIGLTAIAFETVEVNGGLPLLAPMSDIAGRLSVQVATHLLHQPQGGKGILLGGIPAAKRGKVVIIGAGVAGFNAAVVAAGMGAEVTVFDINRDRLVAARALGNNVTGLYPHPSDIADAVHQADILIGAVLIAGEKAPKLVTEDMVRSMEKGSVVVDIAIDQGGCIATAKPTTYADPTYVWEGIVHFTVTHMPGAVPRTASQALSAAIAPYASRLAAGGWEDFAPLQGGINVQGGKVVHPALLKD